MKKQSLKKKRRALRTLPNRAVLIAALGLMPEGKRRWDKYDFSTWEFWQRVCLEPSKAAAKARRKLGVKKGCP